MNIEPTIVLSAAVPAVGALLWLVNLHSRVTVLENRFTDIKTDLGEHRKVLDEINTTLRQFLVQ